MAASEVHGKLSEIQLFNKEESETVLSSVIEVTKLSPEVVGTERNNAKLVVCSNNLAMPLDQ